MIAKLQSLNSSDSAEVIPLERLPVTVGRGLEADVRVLDRFASRQHCRIFQVENQLVVQDLGSTWSTLVNGQPIEEAPLHPGDTLTIGISTFRVDIENSANGSLLSRIEASIKTLGSTVRARSPQVANL